MPLRAGAVSEYPASYRLPSGLYSAAYTGFGTPDPEGEWGMPPPIRGAAPRQMRIEPSSLAVTTSLAISAELHPVSMPPVSPMSCVSCVFVEGHPKRSLLPLCTPTSHSLLFAPKNATSHGYSVALRQGLRPA